MSVLRLTRRTLYTSLVPHTQAAYITKQQFASGGYDGNTGDPKSKEPNKQNPNPSANNEYLTSPSSKRVYGNGNTQMKGAGKGHNISQNLWDQKQPFSTLISRQFNTNPARFADGDNGSRPKSTKGLSPKILKDESPVEDKEPEEVKKHNEELEHRAERVHLRLPKEDVEKEKVGKEFWTGEFVRGAVIHATVGAFVALLIEYW